MKQGTLYAGRLKKAYAKLKQSGTPPAIPDTVDPMRQLAIGVLGVRDGDAAATKALDRLLERMVDWNEVRVSTAAEAQLAIGNTLTDGLASCQRLRTVLQSVFDKVNRLSLDHLKNQGRREARQYLEALNGVDEYAAACVLLWSLGGHAIPVDDRMFDTLRAAELVHPEATRAEVQAFLERHISAADAKSFCIQMRDFVPPKKETASSGPRERASKRKATRGGGERKARTAKRVSKKS